MATATRIEPEPIPTPPPGVYLELSAEEASDLKLLLSYIGGPPEATVRKTLNHNDDSVYNVLSKLGIMSSDDSKLTGLRLGGPGR